VTDVLLDVRGVDVSYGSVQVLFEVEAQVVQGEVLALLGTNGAGKSTLLRAISGLSTPSAGDIWFDGSSLRGTSVADRVRLGIVQVPGGKAIFPDLTVAENLVVGAYTLVWETELVRERAASALELFPKLRDRLEQPAGTMSGGEQQMLAIAKALMLSPRLLLIDELALGLAPVVVGELLGIIESLNASGVTIVIVEQSLNVAVAIAERAVFMEKGQVRFTGPAKDLLERGDLARAVFLGGAVG
jgi:ABC-type branched-subunit amino acid transport system ATPase component